MIWKYCNHSKILPWLKKIVIKKIHACNKINFSSNINEVIRTVLNFLLFFFMKRFQKHKKAQIRLQPTKIKKYV